MERITLKHLQLLVDRINEIKKTSLKPWENLDGKDSSNVGNYHLDGAHGGYALYKIANTCGDVDDVFGCGHISGRDLYNRMQAFLTGLI